MVPVGPGRPRSSPFARAAPLQVHSAGPTRPPWNSRRFVATAHGHWLRGWLRAGGHRDTPGGREQPELRSFSRELRVRFGPILSMMPRRKRCVLPGVACHITRGAQCGTGQNGAAGGRLALVQRGGAPHGVRMKAECWTWNGGGVSLRRTGNRF